MKKYLNYLKKNIFKVDTYNQFNLLLDDFDKINKLKCNHFGIIERTYLYKGLSIFSPALNSKKKLTVFDYKFKNFSPKRVGKQFDWLKDSKFKFAHYDYDIIDELDDINLNFEDCKCDVIIIPNVVHHCSNFELLIKLLVKKLPNLKYIYIFDSALRETHQFPYDYARQTPSSINNIMKKINFESIYNKEVGNAFDVILYFLSQSEKIISNKNNKKIEELSSKLIPLLKSKRNNDRWKGLGRDYAKLYSAYSMIYESKTKK